MGMLVGCRRWVWLLEEVWDRMLRVWIGVECHGMALR